MKLPKIALYSWGVLIYNLFVIIWGAYVRASGSGAGCGSHWPLCNGEVLPINPRIETIIEFSHRLSSGLAFILVIGLLIWTFRYSSKGHPARLGASLSLLFMVTEALVGAGLVLFAWVASDASIGRVISISIHLVNTFLLLASLTLTAWWLSCGTKLHLKGQGFVLWAFGLAALGIVLLGTSGAITALGDTLFPSSSLAEGVRQDFSTQAHLAIRLRIWHPIIAIGIGFYLSFICGLLILFTSEKGDKSIIEEKKKRRINKLSWVLIGFVSLQLLVGLANVALLAPVWIQLIHLLLADLVWISFILLSANTFDWRWDLLTVDHSSDQKISMEATSHQV